MYAIHLLDQFLSFGLIFGIIVFHRADPSLVHSLFDHGFSPAQISLIHSLCVCIVRDWLGFEVVRR